MGSLNDLSYGMTVEDNIEVNVPLKKGFSFFIEDISKWWSKDDEIENKKDGKIVLYWDNGSKLVSSFSKYDEDKEIEFQFGSENLKILFEGRDKSTKISVEHSKIEDIPTLIHVAQSWRFLLLNYKLVLEKNIDLREKAGY